MKPLVTAALRLDEAKALQACWAEQYFPGWLKTVWLQVPVTLRISFVLAKVLLAADIDPCPSVAREGGRLWACWDWRADRLMIFLIWGAVSTRTRRLGQQPALISCLPSLPAGGDQSSSAHVSVVESVPQAQRDLETTNFFSWAQKRALELAPNALTFADIASTADSTRQVAAAACEWAGERIWVVRSTI